MVYTRHSFHHLRDENPLWQVAFRRSEQIQESIACRIHRFTKSIEPSEKILWLTLIVNQVKGVKQSRLGQHPRFILTA